MANIELVIKIPEEVKNRLCFGVTYAEDIQTVCEALHNSTPLSKGHGRLKDIDKIETLLELNKDDNGLSNIAKALKNIIESVPTIIEADKAEREEETIINSPCYTCPFDCDTTCEIYKRWLWKTEENEEREKLIKDLQKNQKLLPMGHYGYNQKGGKE